MYLTQFDQIRNNIRHNLAFDDQITSDESRKRGKELRNQTPRSAHATWNTPENRPSPVSLLLSQAESRVPELLPIRYERMSESPFAFYRGSALIMANDLASTPNSNIRVQACGDAHISNFGMFQSPERRLVFDINDLMKQLEDHGSGTSKGSSPAFRSTQSNEDSQESRGKPRREPQSRHIATQ